MSKITDFKNSDLFPIWLIKSKVHPTRQRIDVVERPSLIRKLDACLNLALSFIHAPAGYGKSTLLANWRNSLLDKNIKMCWLSLDKDDSESFQLLTYIAFALSEGGVDFQMAGIKDNSSLNNLSSRNFLSIINYVIEKQDERIVLVLDDFECLDEETVSGVIKPLLDYAPENLHIAIASRDDQRLRITNLETQGLVVRIQAEDMRFTPNELNAFFTEKLPVNTVKRIYSLTEGWPVAVQIIKNSIDNNQNIDQLLIDLKSSDHVLASYLSEQVFDNLDTDLQKFLMDISIVDRISFAFANFLREDEDSANWFNASRSLSTLVLPVEKVEHTYRLHPMFRDYLYDRLMTRFPQRANTLHVRAAHWFAKNGNIVKAVSHCVHANEPTQAVAIIGNAGGIQIWLQEGLTRLRRVMKLLDDESVFNSPRLVLIRCLINVKDGNVFQARDDFNTALKQYSETRSNLSSIEQEQINHEILLLESLLSAYEGKALSNDFCNQLNKNISKIDSTDHSALGYNFNLLCASYVQKGRFKEALYFAEKAIDEFRLFGSIYGEIYINFHLGDIAFAEGRSQKAENYYKTGLKLARQHFNDDKGIKLVAHILIAELKYELNQIDNLPNIIETIPKQLEEREAWFDIYAAGYITTSNVEFSRYGISAALSILDRAVTYANTQKLNRLLRLLDIQRIVLLLRSGQYTEARTVLQDSGIQLDDYRHSGESEIPWREYSAATLTVIRLKIKELEFDEAISSLNYFSDHAQRHGHIKSHTEYEILKTLVYDKKKDYVESYKHLEKALILSKKSGLVRAFIDHGDELRVIIQQYIDSPQPSNANQEYTEQAKNILDHYNGCISKGYQNELLSKREREVLEQLVHGCSNKVIARIIDISENTVRFHLKNIFVKLHVDTRLQAVLVAKKRNFL